MKTGNIYLTQKHLRLITAFILLGFAFLSSNPYRQFIYTNNLNDLGFAGFAPGIFTVPSVLLIARTFHTGLNILKASLFILLLGIVSEVLSLFTTIGTFDFLDIIGYMIGILVSYCLYKYCNI